jgi:uncharacterized protein (DUF983 family)
MKPLEYIAITILVITVVGLVGFCVYISIDLIPKYPLIIPLFIWLVLAYVSAIYLDQENKKKDKDANDI